MSSKDWGPKIFMIRDESAKMRPPQFQPIRLDKALYESDNTIRIRHSDFQLNNYYPMRNIEIWNKLNFQFFLGPLSPTFDPNQLPQQQMVPVQEQQVMVPVQEQQQQVQQGGQGQEQQQQVISNMEVGFLFKGIVNTQQPITTYNQKFSLSLRLDDIFVSLDGTDTSKEYKTTHEIFKLIDRINSSISPTTSNLTEVGWNIFDTLGIDMSPYVTHLYNTVTSDNPPNGLVSKFTRMPNAGEIVITGAKQ